MAHFFSLPLPPNVSQRHGQLIGHRRTRKRKREDEADNGADSGDDVESGEPQEPAADAEGHSRPLPSSDQDATSSNDRDMQPSSIGKREAERALKELSPHPHPFPHAPFRSHPRKATEADLQKALANLKPPLYTATTASWRDNSNISQAKLMNLRQHHLGILTAVLHRCLLDGDYDRAGRAWGLLLRSEAGSKPVELRQSGRWGIGAEILLQRGHTQAHVDSTNASQSSVGSGNETTASLKSFFSEESFRAAREYYERLILQYPWRKLAQRNSVDATKFYPAMFSLWIFEVCERSRRARQELELKMTSSESPSDFSEHEPQSPPRSSSGEIHIEAEPRITELELAGATEIAERLDRLLSSPPYDNDSNLLELRGMVHMWMGDLFVKNHESLGHDKMDSTMIDEDMSLPITQSKGLPQRQREKQAEMEKAQAILKRAQKYGGNLHDKLSKLFDVSDRSSN